MQFENTAQEYNFAGQYQQSPAPMGGGLVKREWFKSFDLEHPPEFDRVIQSWDTAKKSSELADFSVCTTWGLSGKNAYLLNALRRKMDYPHLKRSVVEHRDLYDSSVILIEDKASGQPLIQELQWGGVEEVVCYTPEGDKVMRLHAQTGMIEGGFVYVPGIAPWLDIYLHELTTFPASKHDDQTDSTSQFLDWSKQASNVKPRKITAIYLGGNSRRSAWDPSSIW